MDVLKPQVQISAFMASHLADFLNQFGINFSIDGPQLEYYVYQKKTGQDISCSLTVIFDEVKEQIDVMTFYPGLFQHPGTRYFSAVCFFLVMQHFASFHKITGKCRICLNSQKAVFESFYGLLKDFNFRILLNVNADRVDIESLFLPMIFDTSMVIERKHHDG